MHNGFEDLDLDRLRRRRSEKWRLHPPDVLPAFIAEMDYDLAEPLLAALREAVGLSDCGYAALDGIGETSPPSPRPGTTGRSTPAWCTWCPT
jgi:cystathionine beta-lyase